MLRTLPPRDPDTVSFDSLRSALFGELREYTLPPHRLNIPGKASGTLVGGNLSVLSSISGTNFDPEPTGRILFLEDLDEYLYHIDRMIMNLKLRGRLKGLAALVTGGMHHMKSSPSGYRKPAYEIIREAVSEYGYPVLFGFPAGHGRPNMSLYLGREVRLEVAKEKCRLAFV
jgi:muramoyltetrapeptide carboxypeptidase